MNTNQKRIAQEIQSIDPMVTYLDADEAFAWLSEATHDIDPVRTLEAALMRTVGRPREKLNVLIEALLKDVTLDQMSDLRDALRAILIDQCRFQILDCLKEVA
jgi:hypothetical protein